MLVRQALYRSYTINTNHVTTQMTLMARRRHTTQQRHAAKSSALLGVVGNNNSAATLHEQHVVPSLESPFDNTATRRYTTLETDASPFDNVATRQYTTLDHSDRTKMDAHHEYRDLSTPSPFDKMAVRRYSTRDHMSRTRGKMATNDGVLRDYTDLTTPSPFETMGVRRFFTLTKSNNTVTNEFTDLSTPSPFEHMAVRRCSTLASASNKTVNDCTDLSTPSPFENMAVRRFSTLTKANNTFTNNYIDLMTPSPFEMMGVRRLSTRAHTPGSKMDSSFTQEYTDLSTPSPFEMIAVRRYSKQVPNVVASPFEDLFIPELSVHEYVLQRCDEWADKTAIVCGISGRSYTYAELRQACSRFARSLRRAGFEAGQVLAIVLPNCPEYPVAMLGAVEAGMVVTTVNPGYVPHEIAAQLLDSSPRVVVTSPDHHEAVAEAIRLAGQRGYQPPTVVVAPSATSDAVPRGVEDFLQMTGSDAVDHDVTRHPVDTTSPVVIPYSSGTTGLPKGVCLSHRNLVANMLQMQDNPILSVSRPTTDSMQEVVPAVLPFYHIYSMNVVLLSKLRLGLKIVTLPKFQPDTFLDTLKTHKATILYLVPPLVLYMGSCPDVTSEHMAHVTTVMSGAAPLGENDVERFMRKATPGVKFIQGYGLTETSPGIFMLVPGGKKMASVGQVLPNTLAKIISMETGEPLGPGEVGEVCCKGPQIMLGYYNNPKATADMLDKDGWLHTGDLGYYDDDKDFFIVDRLKELIKVNALQVAPAELEELLRSHPDVLDAAVIGIPDERSGEVPLGFVVPNPNASSGSLEEDLKSFVESKVSKHKRVAGGIRFVKAIPKSPAGKILRKVLREEYKAGLQQDEDEETVRKTA